MNRVRVAVGLGFWGICFLLVVWALTGQDAARSQARDRWLNDVRQFATGRRKTLTLQLPAPQLVAVGDPIFMARGDGRLEQVGEILALRQAGSALLTRQATVAEVQAILYPTAADVPEQPRLSYVMASDSLAWVVETLLPPERKQQIAAEIGAAMEAHSEEILAALQPVAQRSLRDALSVVEEDLPKVIARHRSELEALGKRYHHELVEQELVPLVKQEIWPIIRLRSEPVVNEVGREIWQRVSLWRFGWRLAYDKLPLTEEHLVREEWQRFVKQEALPILERNTDKFLVTVQDILRDTAKNAEVRHVFSSSTKKLLDDPELQSLVWQIVRETAIDSPRLRQALARSWTSPEARSAFRLASERLEPHARRIGDLILGTPETGITPEFAQVLRNQILYKDRRWFLLNP